MNILAIIPARGGSKGIPRKNLKLINNKPLIAYTIEAALNSKYISKVVVSTDDKEIAKESLKYGSEISIRPESLATDDSPTIDVILHYINQIENKKQTYDTIILLQPTSPLRNEKDIDQAIDIFQKRDSDSVISVSEYSHSPYWSLKIEDNYLKPAFGEKYFKMRRQELPVLYLPNGAIFISTPEHLKKFKSFYEGKVLPYIMSPEKSVDIDDYFDLKLVKTLLGD